MGILMLGLVLNLVEVGGSVITRGCPLGGKTEDRGF